MKTKKKVAPERLNIAGIKDRPGWTDAAIRKFLGEPDELRANPIFKTAAPQKLWDTSKIKAVEDAPEFQDWKAKSLRRSKSAQQVADRKRAKARRWAENVPIHLRCPSELSRVEDLAIHAYNERLRERQERYDKFYDFLPASKDANRELLSRITVNFLRHDCTEYDSRLEDTFGVVGRVEASRIVRRRVYDVISGRFPDLAGECRRQMRYRGLSD